MSDDTDPESEAGERELPENVLDEAERLTRLAREAVDDAERTACIERRERLLADHGFTGRVRREHDREVLVAHPEEWVEGGTVVPDRIDDLDRAEERPLSGPGDPDEWEAVADHNESLAGEVRDRHGDVHGDNAVAFADFMSNHYARRVETASGEEVTEFLEEYFPRNAFPSDEQKAVVGRSLELLFDVAGTKLPEP